MSIKDFKNLSDEEFIELTKNKLTVTIARQYGISATTVVRRKHDAGMTVNRDGLPYSLEDFCVLEEHLKSPSMTQSELAKILGRSKYSINTKTARMRAELKDRTQTRTQAALDELQKKEDKKNAAGNA